MLMQQIFASSLLEAINVPYAFDVFHIIEDCSQHAKTAGDLRALMTARLGAFFRAKFNEMQLHQSLNLDVHIAEPAGNYHGGGVFRSFNMDHNIADENGLAHDGLPPVPDQTVELWSFISDFRLESLLQTFSYDKDPTVQSIGSTLIHEFVHLIQYCRSNGLMKSPNRYTVGVKRPKVDGKRAGKRGEYVSPDVNPQAYYGTAIEIEAHAATAAAEIVHRARKENTAQEQRAYLEQVLRSLRDNSGSVMTYKEKFYKPSFFLGRTNSNPAKSAQIKRQKAIVWKEFRTKLAKHLTDYIKALPSQSD